MTMLWQQSRFTLAPYPRGFHLITREVSARVDGLERIDTGMLHLFIQHTSASLTINENASRDVLRDFERHFNEMIPEGAPYWEHTIEGPDDMPAHIKASLLGSAVTIPVRRGELLLGTWQGIYLCEHRDRARGRSFVATAFGDEV